MLVATGSSPGAEDPGVAELVGTGHANGGLDGDKLAVESLPEVQAVLGGLEHRVHSRNTADIVGNGKDIAAVEARVLLGGRAGSVLANDIGDNGVVARDNLNVAGRGKLGQVEVGVGGPRALRASVMLNTSGVLAALTVMHAPVLENGAVKLDDVANSKVCADIAVKDVDGLRGQVVVVGHGGADPDTVGTLGEDEAFNSRHILSLERRQELVAVDLGNGGSRNGTGEGEKGGGDLHLGGSRRSQDGDAKVD